MTPSAPALATALTAERDYHDACRAALNAMIEGAGEQVVVGEGATASGADAEVLGYELRSRAKQLRELPDGPLFFGRLDFAADAAAARDHAGQSYHVGRMRITRHPSVPPLVIDWRAPVSRAFYQASTRHPQGVEIRRRFGWSPGSRGEAGDLTSLEDERLEQGESQAGGILASEIERPRVGPMRDIAATIQPEQDDLVRADLTASVCVQGAPGTGKTAVGLHRAAYLLYTFPRRLQRTGMLILGPNRTFLSYIGEVLPALGEFGVRQSTLEDEIARQPLGSDDGQAAAVVKHDSRMAEVLHRALYAGVRPAAAADLAVPDGSYRWRVPAPEIESIVADVRAEQPPYATGRERVRTRLVIAVQQQAERRAGPRSSTWMQKIARARPLTTLLDALWPAARPEEVLATLLGDPHTLAAAADGVLDMDEQKALRWERPPRSPKSARWSAADLVLLDELAGQIEHPQGYGHIVIDEAQDLSPMQARAIARRSRFGSLTVLGDLAQGTTLWAARDWPALLAHLGKPDAAIVPLTTGFRVPGAVAELANGLLDRLDVAVPPARSLRRDGQVRVSAAEEVTAEAVTAVRAALEGEGSIGVIAADTDTAGLRRVLAAAGIEAAGPQELDVRVSVVPASAAKGLEYDHVIAVEPAAIVAAEPRGLHRLYVVLTRAVSRLDIVHAKPLPFTPP